MVDGISVVPPPGPWNGGGSPFFILSTGFQSWQRINGFSTDNDEIEIIRIEQCLEEKMIFLKCLIQKYIFECLNFCHSLKFISLRS
jgi:hypothetical protein